MPKMRYATALAALTALLLSGTTATAAAATPDPIGSSAIAGEGADRQLPAFQGTGVTAKRRESVELAHGRALRYAGDSLTAVPANMGPHISNTYKKWFGIFDHGRRDKVHTTYQAVVRTLRDDTITYVIPGPLCQDDWYAYAHHGVNTVNLCREFWKLPATGASSKVGKIIHELTHVTVNTGDHAYGRVAARQLAKDAPGNAVDNADNYEYFAEDTSGD